MIPSDRKSFTDYCLRKFGFPVISINTSEEQNADRVDEALLYFNRFHYDGTEKLYYKYQIQPADITNRYITMPDNVFGVVRIFDITGLSGTNNLFSASFQVAINDLFTLNGFDLVPYYSTMQNLGLIQEILVGRKQIRYNAVSNKLYIDMDWTTALPGTYLLVECYNVLNPESYPRIWEEEWLQRYATALIKQQWGNNLKKYQGMQMPGGTSFSGQQIWQEATDELKELQYELINTYSLPNCDFIG